MKRLAYLLFFVSLPLFTSAQSGRVKTFLERIQAAKRKGEGEQAAKLEVYLGNTYMQEKQRGNATNAYKSALGYSQADAETKGLASLGLAKNGQGSIYFDQATRYFKIAQKWELYYKALDAKGGYYLNKNQLKPAQGAYEEMRSGASQYGFVEYVKLADQKLKRIYEKTGQQANARRIQNDQSSSVVRNQSVSSLREKERKLEDERRVLDSLLTLASDDSLQKVRLQRELDSITQESLNTQAEKEEKIKDLEVEKARVEAKHENTQRLAIAVGIAALAIIIVVTIAVIITNNANKKLKKKNDEVNRQKKLTEEAREKSEELLLNILPASVAEELKEHGKAEPKQYDQATVIFTDFKGFTKIAEKMTPQELIRELDEYFLEFDEILERHGLEKIKTIGDAYMCVGGLPVPNETHAANAVKAGLDMQQFVLRKQREKEAAGKPFFQLRVGINSGPLVAGVVGRKKFAYDIWGDTVNVAARMEQSGEVNKVNISGATYELIKDQFNCVYRGKVPAKNKGEIDMYFVEGISWDAVKEGKISF